MSAQLLTPDESSYETSVAGWAKSGVAGTLTRSTSSSIGLTDSGVATAILTATAVGTITKTLVRKAPVVAGTLYTFREVIVTSVATTASCAIQWYNASNSIISTSTGNTTTTVGVTEANGVSVVATAPVGAVTATVSVSAVSPSTSFAAICDRAQFVENPNPTGNLLTFEEFSAESSTPAMSVTGAGWTTARVNRPTSGGFADGPWHMAAMPGAVGTSSFFTLDRYIPVTPGTVYTGKLNFTIRKGTSAGPVKFQRRVRVLWFDASNVEIVDPTADPLAEITLSQTAATTYTSWSSTAKIAPPDAAYARIGGEIKHMDASVTAYGMDSLRFQPGNLEYTFVSDDVHGMVSLNILFEPDASSAATTYSVTRFTETGEAAPVRYTTGDAVRLPWTGGPVLYEDYEVPMGGYVWYLAQWWNAAGFMVAQLSTWTFLGPTISDPSNIWLKSPGVPATNTQVIMENPPTWSRAARQTLTDIVGRSNPIPVFDVRASRNGDITVLVWDWGSNDLLNKLLDSGAVALIQAMPGYGLPANLYVSIGDAQSEPLTGDATQPGWRWTLPVVEVDRPIGGIKGSASRTWDLVEDAATWFDIFNTYDTWEEVLIGTD